MDGRDIGSVVFQMLKFKSSTLSASSEVRARRRQLELEAKVSMLIYKKSLKIWNLEIDKIQQNREPTH